VKSSNSKNKTITINTTQQDGKCRIEISDNGVGIDDKNLKRVFNYGFTTKESGHGFGLHTSALAVNALGGTMDVVSEGIGKGATFVIVL